MATKKMPPWMASKDKADDKKRGIKDGSPRDNALDKKRGVPVTMKKGGRAKC